MLVIDRGSRTQPKSDARQCRCGSDTLRLYATVGLLRSCREDAHTMQGFSQIPEKPPIPSRRENRNIAGRQKTDFFDCQYHKIFAGIILVGGALSLCAARLIFLAPAKQKSAPILVLGI